VGLDLGERRVGVAVSDTGRTLASPRTTVTRTGDPDRDLQHLVDVITEEEPVLVVVGLPLSLDGRRGAQADRAVAEAERLAGRLAAGGIGTELFDERLTTVSAATALAAAGTPSRKRRSVIDRSAATVLLQAWIDREQATVRRARGTDRG